MTKKKEKTQEEKVKKLTKVEHLEMELNFEEVLRLESEKKLETERKQNHLLRMKIAELESKRQLELLDKRLTTIDSRLKRLREDIRTYNQAIKKKYKIKDKFGINPDTGEIMEE